VSISSFGVLQCAMQCMVCCVLQHVLQRIATHVTERALVMKCLCVAV